MVDMEGQPLSVFHTEGGRADPRSVHRASRALLGTRGTDLSGETHPCRVRQHPCRTFLQGISPLGMCSLYQLRLWLYLPSLL